MAIKGEGKRRGGCRGFCSAGGSWCKCWWNDSGKMPFTYQVSSYNYTTGCFSFTRLVSRVILFVLGWFLVQITHTGYLVKSAASVDIIINLCRSRSFVVHQERAVFITSNALKWTANTRKKCVKCQLLYQKTKSTPCTWESLENH